MYPINGIHAVPANINGTETIKLMQFDLFHLACNTISCVIGVLKSNL